MLERQVVTKLSPGSFKGKRVIVRVDFNVPQNKDLTVADDSRIVAALPTINFLRSSGARIVLLSHLGRPKGVDKSLSLEPIAHHLSNLTGIPVRFVSSCIGLEAERAVNDLRDGEICLLENLRFHKEEEEDNSEFSKQLARLGDIYVNDAFGTAHRAHASTHGVTQFVRPALAGLLMDRELKVLSSVLYNPTRPFATIIGGAKVSSKIAVLESLLPKVDIMIVGGAMAFSFLKAQEKQVGKSLVEDDRLEFCRLLDKKAKQLGVKLILPIDVVCAPEMSSNSKAVTVGVDCIPVDQIGLDLGPQTCTLIAEVLDEARTIFWNGPLGVFEIPSFAGATNALIDCLVELTKKGVTTIVGGGDSVAAIETRGASSKSFSHVSTGGGASLEFMEGIELPGVACLDEAENVKAYLER